MKKQLTICGAILCLAFTAFAQKGNYTFLFPITDMSLEETEGKIIISDILDLKIGQEAIIYGVYHENQKGRNKQIGSAKIKQINGSKAVFTYQMSDDFYIEVGDLLAFDFLLPENETLAFELYRLNIGLIDIEGEPLFDSKYSIKQTDTYLFEILLKDAKYVASAMREQMTSPMIEGGRYKDTDLFTAMENSTWEDIRSFLRYIQARPLKYQGLEWKFSEIYATWLHSNAPTTIEDLSELLRYADDKSLGKYTTGVTDEAIEECAEKWRNQAEVLSEKGALDEASKLVDASLKLGDFFKNEAIIAWSYYNKGGLLNEAEDMNQAIEYYQKALVLFEKNKNDAGILIVGNNIGNAYNEMRQYKKALKELEKAYELHKPLQESNNEVINGVGALILRNQGDSYVGLKKYKKAIKKYEEGLVLVEKATGQKALTRKASICLKLSEIYSMLANFEMAKKYDKKAQTAIEEMTINVWDY